MALAGPTRPVAINRNWKWSPRVQTPIAAAAGAASVRRMANSANDPRLAGGRRSQHTDRARHCANATLAASLPRDRLSIMNRPHASRPDEERCLAGQFLLAMPGMTDPNFARSLVYICAHSAEGAMGLVVNAPAPEITFSELLHQLGVTGGEAAPPLLRKVPIFRGGPVETSRGFVLHSADYAAGGSTVAIATNVRLTITLDILKALAEGTGPSRALLALGYAGWMPGQLESEILANGWLTAQADADVIFDPDSAAKYERVLAGLGIGLANLSSTAGRA